MKKKKTIYKPFDAAAYLDNDAVIAEYLSAAAEDPNPEVFVAALGDVAKATRHSADRQRSGPRQGEPVQDPSCGRTPTLRNNQFCPARPGREVRSRC